MVLGVFISSISWFLFFIFCWGGLCLCPSVLFSTDGLIEVDARTGRVFSKSRRLWPFFVAETMLIGVMTLSWYLPEV